MDCSSYVSYVLWVSNIQIGRKNSYWFKNKGFQTDKRASQYNWKIVPWNELSPGDILVKEGHVEFYREGSTTYCAGGTWCIRHDHSDYKSVERIKGYFNFAVRVSKSGTVLSGTEDEDEEEEEGQEQEEQEEMEEIEEK